MIGNGLVPINVGVSPETKRGLQALADLGNCSVSEIVREVLDAAVNESDDEELRRIEPAKTDQC